MRFLLIVITVLFGSTVFAQMSMTIENIDPSTLKFERAGLLEMGPLEMSFEDREGNGYTMSCGGDNLNMRFMNFHSLSNVMINGKLENCFREIVGLQMAQDRGEVLTAIEFGFSRMSINGRMTGYSQIDMNPIYQ